MVERVIKELRETWTRVGHAGIGGGGGVETGSPSN